MILYLDTSALAKLYIEERGTVEVVDAVQRAISVGTSLISYAEMRSVLARRGRAGDIAPAQLRKLVHAFEKDWAYFTQVQMGETLVRQAGDLAQKHGLRALDAIHLASALVFRTTEHRSIYFLTADERLEAAARREGLLIRV